MQDENTRHTSLPSIFAKAAGHEASAFSPERMHSPQHPQTAHAVPGLSAGSCDFLRLAEEPPATSHSASMAEKSAVRQHYERWNIVRDHLLSQGDRVIHFSGEATEMINSLPVKRYVLVTDAALYRVAQSTIETGIFFDCRTNLDHLAQLIAMDTQTEEGHGFGGFEVQAYLKNKRQAGAVDLAYTLNFGSDSARRKAFLLSVCVVRPTLPVLQKRRIDASTPTTATPHDNAKSGGRQHTDPNRSPAAAAASGREGSASRQRRRGPSFMRPTASSAIKSGTEGSSSLSNNNKPTTTPPQTTADGQTPVPKLALSSQSPVRSAPRFRSLEASAATPASPQQQQQQDDDTAAGTPPPPPAISEDDFEGYKSLLHSQLHASNAEHTGDYDAERAMRRPPEEDISRTMEREQVKAMLTDREQKIVQNIEFKLKYPQKVPTRVAPGVEFDKAHEERRVPPDDFTDSDLLGPSLHPLWAQWKETGGLLGHNGMPTSEWTMYDANDLIDSLRAREDVLYGLVGKRSMRRLIQMRELVEREKQMFLNKQSMVLGGGDHSSARGRRDGEDDDDNNDDNDEYGGGAGGSPHRSPDGQGRSRATVSSQGRSRDGGRAHKGIHTKTKPFNLSQSQFANRKVRILDSNELLGEMKKNFEAHLKELHRLRKDQLEREVQRAEE